MDVFNTPNLNSGNVLVDIFGASGLLGHASIPSSASGGFFGVVSDGEAITRLVVNDTDIEWAADNIAFGSPKSVFDHFACYEVEVDKDKKDNEQVILLNQFEGGTKVKVGKLKLLCVPTHKVHDKDHRLP
jgi:hypothetical protein